MYISLKTDEGLEMCMNMDMVAGFFPRCNGGTSFAVDLFANNFFASSTPYEEVKAQVFGKEAE